VGYVVERLGFVIIEVSVCVFEYPRRLDDSLSNRGRCWHSSKIDAGKDRAQPARDCGHSSKR
jgi:hypothetical protein